LANQKLAMAMLKKWGHQVTLATNGREAVEAFERSKFDLILMDVQMPELDGLDATRRIRELEKARDYSTPILAMTAHAMPGDREKCLQAGMDGYLSKPVRKNNLYEALNDLSRNRSESTNEPLEGSADHENAIDWREAIQVVAGDEPTLKEIAAVAVEEMTELMERLNAGVQQSDVKEIKESAHTIQGTLRVFPNETTAERLVQIQQHAEEANLVAIRSSFEDLQPRLASILDQIQQYHRGDFQPSVE
jgi:CheY-like chemotaxis protein